MLIIITVLVIVVSLIFSSLIAQHIKWVTISQLELGLVYRNGKLTDVFGPGEYFCYWNKKITIVDLTKPFQEKHELNLLLEFNEILNQLDVYLIEENQIGLEYKDGVFMRVLIPGRYAYWNSIVDYDIKIMNKDEVEIPESISRKVIAKSALAPYVYAFKVNAWEQGLLYIDGVFKRKLTAGTYYFWKTEQLVDIKTIDLRAQQTEISGQEILSKDKASLRINFDVQYKIVDIEKALIDTKDAIKLMYTSVQLALREYIGTMTLDNILARKDEVAPFVIEQTKDRLTALGIEILNCGMRDIILPGDVKEIINQVLIAQKKAQANTIMRQEETASTRSLLNTAKLMEQNDMLFKLKEMEYMERIADKVGEITVGGGDRILSQLTNMFEASKS